jgi:prevent-host-death family protein
MRDRFDLSVEVQAVPWKDLRATTPGEAGVMSQSATMCYMAVVNPSRVGVRELRQNLSVYLDRVKRGESLTVTEHGQVVAVLQPPPVRAEGVLERLVREGLATPALFPPSTLPMPMKVKRRGKKTLSQIVDEMREDTI